MTIVLSPIAETVKNWAASRVQSVPHNFVPIKRKLGSPEASQMVAIIVFEIIDIPVRKAHCVI